MQSMYGIYVGELLIRVCESQTRSLSRTVCRLSMRFISNGRLRKGCRATATAAAITAQQASKRTVYCYGIFFLVFFSPVLVVAVVVLLLCWLLDRALRLGSLSLFLFRVVHACTTYTILLYTVHCINILRNPILPTNNAQFLRQRRRTASDGGFIA